MARTSSTLISYNGLPPPACICASSAAVAGSTPALIGLPLVDQIQEQPLLAACQPGELASGAAKHHGCRGDVLGAGMHVTEQALHRPRTEGDRSGRLVREVGDLVRRPGCIG